MKQKEENEKKNMSKASTSQEKKDKADAENMQKEIYNLRTE